MARISPGKNTPTLTRAITRNALMILFLIVFFLSVLVGPQISVTSLFFSVVKGLVAVGLGWVFLLVISDALVRSITASAIDTHATRRDGGLLYHFLPPDPDEVLDGEAPEPKKKAKKK